MNSVDKHLTALSKAATLLAMRSAKKEILLIVEGDTDVDVFANALGLPRSNILSCDGKEILMDVYKMDPQKGIDEGSIFIRDRDTDNISTRLTRGVLLLVTKRYDIEMELLENRIFQRILSEFLKKPLDNATSSLEFSKICSASACIGAIRIYSNDNKGTNLDFDDLKYGRFLNYKSLAVNIGEAVRYMFAKSKTVLNNHASVVSVVSNIMQTRPAADIVCSKEFVDVLHHALSRHYNACDAGECSPTNLNRTIRISAVQDDFKLMDLYQPLSAHVAACEYSWVGSQL